MKRKGNRIFGRIISLTVCAAMALALSSCGGRAAGNAESASGNSSDSDAQQFVYVPEFVGIDSEDASLYDTYMLGEDLYYTSIHFESESETQSYTLHKWSAVSRTAQDRALELPENAGINGFAVGPDDCVYAVLDKAFYDENGDYEDSEVDLAKFDGQGKLLSSQNVTELVTDEAGDYYQARIETDGQGRVYLLTNDGICLFDGELQPAGTVELPKNAGSSQIDCWGHGADGKVYAMQLSYGENESKGTLYEIDFEAKKLGTGLEGFPSIYSNCLAQDADGNFWVYDQNAVYRYDPKAQEKEKVFSWLESDINGDYINGFGILPDGRIMLVYADWESHESGVALLTKTDASQIVQKKQIVIGTMSTDQQLQAAAVNFNKSNDDYRIEIRAYMDSDNWSENSYEDAVARMNNDITSGNCPDIINLDSVNTAQYAAKGVFQDLTPYLEQSTVLDREDMIDSVMNAYTYDGVLVAVPDSFGLETVFGSRQQLGDRMGWTLEEMTAFADAHQDQELFDLMPKDMMMQYLMRYNLDSFVDWKTGTCRFDTEEFKSLLEFVSRYPDVDDVNWGDRPSTPERIQDGEVLLIPDSIYELDSIQLYEEMFQGDVTPIGFPGLGGSGCTVTADGCYAIAASSEVKDGAWRFIEQYLTREDTWMRYGFPNSRSSLEETAEELLRGVEDGGKSYGWGNFNYNYRKPTQEEIDMVFDMIDSAMPASGGSEQLLKIINEEAAPFFQGQKSVDEVTKIIQSRIQIYVSENS